MNTYICENCGKEHDGSYGSGRFCSKSCKASFNVKKRNMENVKKVLIKARASKKTCNETINCECQFCGKQYNSNNALHNHERLCKLNPNRDTISHTEKWYEAMAKTKGHPRRGGKVWTDELRKAQSELMKTDLNPSKRQDVRDKISKTMKERFASGEYASIWHTQLEKRKSIAEEYFDRCFPDLKQNYHVDRYFLDLANPDKKLYIEIDGEQHYNNQKIIEHDTERTKRLEELGWICIKRIRWSEYKKLSKDEQISLIETLKKQI